MQNDKKNMKTFGVQYRRYGLTWIAWVEAWCKEQALTKFQEQYPNDTILNVYEPK